MIKTIISLSLLSTMTLGVELTANQNKAYVTDGSIEVSGYGISQTIQSGEMTTYGENIAPTEPRKFYDIDIRDIQIELEAPDELVHDNIINKEYINTLHVPKVKFQVMGVKG